MMKKVSQLGQNSLDRRTETGKICQDDYTPVSNTSYNLAGYQIGKRDWDER